MQIVTPMPQFLAYRETRTRGKARDPATHGSALN